MKTTLFDQAYKALNTAQKEAVDSIDGPVMVVAGPGTGKTQVLALRIANILLKTDIGASGVLCLTFTNSGVSAMRERLKKYIGTTANDVKVATFHSFAQGIVERKFELLDLPMVPQILDEQASVLLFDEILNSNDWEYLRPRNNPSQYFYDLKSLISLLKRESVTIEEFKESVDQEIKKIENDPGSISSRGESKGKLKKEIEKKIESLKRTKEAATFYQLYEEQKREVGYMDYDDVLSYALGIIKTSDDVASGIREENQYILIDEHQDSSGIQNELLKAIWSNTERPNIFVVGDDRQLIYGFGGASISYFEEFKNTFGKAHLITLVENYRSTQKILDTADILLKSKIAEGSLKSNTKDLHDIVLYPCQYERDEILLAGKVFKEKIASDTSPESCALLVPKNKNVRSAVRILRDLGLPVVVGQSISLFDLEESDTFKNILKVVANPYDNVALGELLFAKTSNINPLEAHAFLRSISTRDLSLNDLLSYRSTEVDDLFSDSNSIKVLGKKLESFMHVYKSTDVHGLIQSIGTEYFINTSADHNNLVKNAEIVRTYIHLAIALLEKNPHMKLSDFLEFLDRLESYKEHIPLATIGSTGGVQVMTLHGSKGLEFEVVHIAHMNESTIMRGKKGGFTLPEIYEHMIEGKDELTAKREIYVALTRAKRFCSLSYAKESFLGSTLELARVISEIPNTHIVEKNLEESVEIITEGNPFSYIQNNHQEELVGIKELVEIVKKEYQEKNVSVTLLNNFFECSFKWYFSSFLQLPSQKSESLILGSVVHLGIEYILKEKIKPAVEILKNVIDNALDKELVSNKLLRSRIQKKAQSILSDWVKNYYPNVHKSYMTERSISYHDKNLSHLKFYGKIDLTENQDNGVVVTDFKTGSSKTSSAIEKRDTEGRLSPLLRQLAMYSYLLNGQKVINSKLLFLEEDPKDKNAVYSTYIGDEEIDLLIRDIKDYDEALKSGTWVTRECNFKPYGSDNTECEYCALAKIYKK